MCEEHWRKGHQSLYCWWPCLPLLDWLMKGYPNSHCLTPQQESFNIYFSSVRVGVEMTFRLLKSRWRVLLKRSDFHFSLHQPWLPPAVHSITSARGRETMPTAVGWKRVVTMQTTTLSLTSQWTFSAVLVEAVQERHWRHTWPPASQSAQGICIKYSQVFTSLVYYKVEESAW